MNRPATIAVAAIAVVLAACGNDQPGAPDAPAPKVGDAAGTSVAQGSVPPAPTDRDSPPASTPSTHAGTPQPEAPPAPTARDTHANQPMGELTKPKDNASLPLAGQVNNHSSTALDQPNKTAPQNGNGEAKPDKP